LLKIQEQIKNNSSIGRRANFNFLNFKLISNFQIKNKHLKLFIVYKIATSAVKLADYIWLYV